MKLLEGLLLFNLLLGSLFGGGLSFLNSLLGSQVSFLLRLSSLVKLNGFLGSDNLITLGMLSLSFLLSDGFSLCFLLLFNLFKKMLGVLLLSSGGGVLVLKLKLLLDLSSGIKGDLRLLLLFSGSLGLFLSDFVGFGNLLLSLVGFLDGLDLLLLLELELFLDLLGSLIIVHEGNFILQFVDLFQLFGGLLFSSNFLILSVLEIGSVLLHGGSFGLNSDLSFMLLVLLLLRRKLGFLLCKRFLVVLDEVLLFLEFSLTLNLLRENTTLL